MLASFLRRPNMFLTDPEKLRLVHWLTRIGCTAFLTFFVLASLLTFPSEIPWMVACWLLGHTVLAFRNRPGWLPLAACAAILFIKRLEKIVDACRATGAEVIVAQRAAQDG